MISIVITTYNNTKQLLTNLKHNLPYLKGNEIIIINDFPDQSIEDKIKLFPEIKLIENKQNLGFAGAVHVAILQTSSQYIMLLNDDVLLQDTSFMKGVESMQKDSSLFGVSFAQKEKNKVTVGKNMIYWNNGFFQHKKVSDLQSGFNGWVEGGSCLIDKKKYLIIGGFDPLYSPFYWEDIDLSYRAWKAGFHILYDPNITVIHHHESTIGKLFNNKYIKTIAFRNQFIFIWKNIESKKLVISHIGRLFYFLPLMLFKDRSFVTGFCKAVGKLPAIMQHKNKGVFSDEEILNKFK